MSEDTSQIHLYWATGCTSCLRAKEFLERTIWHAGQHTRQLRWVLEKGLNVTVDPLELDIWEDLPMPEKVWDAM